MPTGTKLSYWRWPMIVVGILVCHVTAMVIAAAIATSHPGDSAAIPDSYQKGQAWDQHRQRIAASAKLGWTAELSPVDQRDGLGRSQMRMTLIDSAHRPITNASLNVQFFHLAHGDQPEQVNLPPSADGNYLVPLTSVRKGFWQFDITATAGKDEFIQTITRDVP